MHRWPGVWQNLVLGLPWDSGLFTAINPCHCDTSTTHLWLPFTAVVESCHKPNVQDTRSTSVDNFNKLFTFNLINLNTYQRWNKCFAEYHSSSAALGFRACHNFTFIIITPQKAALWIESEVCMHLNCSLNLSSTIKYKKEKCLGNFIMWSDVGRYTNTWMAPNQQILCYSVN